MTSGHWVSHITIVCDDIALIYSLILFYIFMNVVSEKQRICIKKLLQQSWFSLKKTLKIQQSLHRRVWQYKEQYYAREKISKNFLPFHTGSLNKKKPEKVWSFTIQRGGEYPQTPPFPFFPKGRTFVVLKWSTSSETWKKNQYICFLHPSLKHIQIEKPVFQ